MRRAARLALVGLLLAAVPRAAGAFNTFGQWKNPHTKLYIGNLDYFWGSELVRAARVWGEDSSFDYNVLGDGNVACERYKSGVLIYPFSEQPLMNGVEFNKDNCFGTDFDEVTLAVTWTIMDDDGNIDRAGLVFNDAFNWKVFHGANGDTTFDFHRVAVHELGHWLGMDHSEDLQSIMYPIISDSIDTLQPDDIAGVQSLYPTGPPAPSPILAAEALCRSRQLDSAAKYCKRQLACSASHAKDASRDVAARDACLGSAAAVFSANWDAAIADGAGACKETAAATSMAPVVQAAAGVAADQVGLGDAANPADRALRSKLMKQASSLCNADFGAWQKEAASPNAAKLTNRLDKARGRFVASGGKAISKAAASGVSYDGATPDAVADPLETVANTLGDSTAP